MPPGWRSARRASTFAGDEVWRSDWLAAADLAGSPLIPPAIDAGRAYAETGGVWAEEAGVPAGIPVIGGLNDGIGSIVGAAGSVIGRATDPGGAAGGLAVCWPEKLSAPGVDCWAGLVPGTFIIGGAFVAGGRAMDWWAGIGAEGNLERALALAETSPAGARGLVCLPFLAGERSPCGTNGAQAIWASRSSTVRRSRARCSGTAYEPSAVRRSGGCWRASTSCACVGGQARVDCGTRSRPTSPVAGRARLPEVALMGIAICAALGAEFYGDLFSGEPWSRWAKCSSRTVRIAPCTTSCSGSAPRTGAQAVLRPLGRFN